MVVFDAAMLARAANPEWLPLPSSANVLIAFFTFLCFSQAYFLLIAYFHLFLLFTFLHTFYELITYVNLSTLLLAGMVNRLQLIMIGHGEPQSTKQKR